MTRLAGIRVLRASSVLIAGVKQLAQLAKTLSGLRSFI